MQRRSLVILALAALAVPAAGALRYYGSRWRAPAALINASRTAGDGPFALTGAPDRDPEGEIEDDARLRRLAREAWDGPRGPEFQRELLEIARAEAARWSESMPRIPRGDGELTANATAPINGQSWVNLGPTDALFQYNGSLYTANDSGRPRFIRVDPRSASVVYNATSGGGIWKTWNFGAAGQKWMPITETLGNLAIGAMDLDPQAPDTVWVGLGDFTDTEGGQVVRSDDGGGTWGAPIALSGTAAGIGAVTAVTVRDLAVSPTNRDLVLAATEVGLFRSTNATSASPAFALVNLPNGAADVAEGPWTIAYLGSAGGQSHWVVSGMRACDATQRPPRRGFGDDAGCPGFTDHGDIWRSTDSGATWTSLRTSGALNAVISAVSGFGEVGRIALAAAPNATSPTSATIYAQVSNIDGSTNAGIWKSTNGGQAWTSLVTANTLPTNPTAGGDCGTMDVAHDQSWYNLAIAVDPGDANNVIVGGNLCGARSTNGGSTWSMISHWLPSGGGASTSQGTLPYVHADWHAATISRVGGTLVAFAGTDGGVFSSTNVFTATPPSIAWTSRNAGIVTHLAYSIASGDPVDGNGQVAFMGLQDNGTRFRDTTSPTIFNQVIGGDGMGAAVGGTASGTNIVYWGSVQAGGRRYCVPASGNSLCNKGASGVWASRSLTLPSGDGEPFVTKYSPVQGDPNSAVITSTSRNVFKSSGTTSWTRITPSGIVIGTATASIRNIHAAQRTYGASTRLYGLALNDGQFGVIADTGAAQTLSTAATKLGLGTYSAKPANYVQFASSITFPAAAANIGGTTDGTAYLASSAGTVMNDGTLIPASVGHLFKTTNNGAAWTVFHGNGSGQDLPNVPIQVVRFDPGDATDKTIYVGTDLGLYRSTDGGNTWHRFGVGLPMVRVTDIFISRNGSMLRVSTFGRGIWEIQPNASVARGVAGSGDWDRNLAIDGFDLGALASRLGTSPATATAPFYDWNLDLAGTQNALDEADLTALLAKFGDHP